MIHSIKRITAIALMLILLLNLYGCMNAELNVNIFSNIEECEKISTLNQSQANIQIYDMPTKDTRLKELEYQEFFGCKYIHEDYSFELFAYEFLNSDIAMAYFKNETGKGADPNPTFSDRSGIFSYRRIVVNNNMAYIVTCKNIHKDKVIDYINTCFSVNVFFK